MQHRTRGQRGIFVITMALWLTAFLGLSVVAIDIGRVAFTANEVHAVADIAATAGAIALTRNRDPVADAQAVVRQNSVDGQQASIAASDIVVGNYNATTGTFTAGGAPASAVRAHASATVNNVMAAVLGQATSTVERYATAAFETLESAVPGLPLGMGDCFNCYPGQCSTQPILIRFYNTPNNNGGWLVYNSNNAENDILSYIPSTCCDPANPTNRNGCGGGQTNPVEKAGDSVSLTNGALTRVCKALTGCVGQKFLVPVLDTPCGSPFNSSGTTIGFATITILPQDPTTQSCTGNLDHVIPVQPSFVDCREPTNASICKGYQLGGSCAQCGTGVIALVQ